MEKSDIIFNSYFAIYVKWNLFLRRIIETGLSLAFHIYSVYRSASNKCEIFKNVLYFLKNKTKMPDWYEKLVLCLNKFPACGRDDSNVWCLQLVITYLWKLKKLLLWNTKYGNARFERATRWRLCVNNAHAIFETSWHNPCMFGVWDLYKRLGVFYT